MADFAVETPDQARQRRYRESGRKAEVEKARYERDKEQHYERVRNNAIWNQYGLARHEYDFIMSWECFICGEPSEALDHCHETGEIRGPLCRNCNVGLGLFNDNSERLTAAARYLEESIG
jgi:hypothetical protein